MMRPFIYSMLIVALLGSCIPKPLDIEVQPAPAKLVVNSLIVPNQLMVVHLSRSFSALSYQSSGDTLTDSMMDTITVLDGTVIISYRDQVDTLYSDGEGLFYSLFMPAYNNEVYSLYAHDNDRNLEVTAMERMLELVKFDTVYPVIVESTQDTTVTFKYSFTDPPGDNWYVVNYLSKLNTLGNGIDMYDIFNSGTNLLIARELISDKEFGGGAYSADFLLKDVMSTDSVAVSLSNISEEYYKYLGLREKSNNWFSQITNEPINYPTNVVGGYGFFSTHYPDIKTFELEDY